MEGETTKFTNFLTLSPGHIQVLEECYIDPVVFINDDLWPTTEACDSISFSCGPNDEDVLSTAASDSEDIVGDLCSSLPPSGQEKCTSPSYIELLDVVTHAVDKLGLDWNSEPVQSQAQSKLADQFLTSCTPSQPHRPLPLDAPHF